MATPPARSGIDYMTRKECSSEPSTCSGAPLTVLVLRLLVAALVVPVAACQSLPSSSQVIIIARPALAGEALFHGELVVVRGCVVAKGDRRNSAVLFDPGVTLLPSGEGLHDSVSGNDIPFGQRINAGGAVLRENGKGWPISDIESFYGVTIPADCPKENVMRLRALK